MDFNERLDRAIQRGRQSGRRKAEAEAQQKWTEKEFQRVYSTYRLELSEKIEQCLKSLADHFPGFDQQAIVDDRGWGAIISRDDVRLVRGQAPENDFSRFEMVIRPFRPTHVLDLAAKATINNRELFNRNYFELLAEVDPSSFTERIDQWALEFAEHFAQSP
jgi:hypothetical protein